MRKEVCHWRTSEIVRTGFVELVYKGQRIMTVLSVGAEITIEREGVVTIIQRITDSSFHIDSYIGAA